jgi:hypothetical protein
MSELTDEIDRLTAELTAEKQRADRAERRYQRKCREDYEDILPLEYTGTIHHLKTIQPYYDASENLTKTFEIRKDDRGYKVGDILHLKEWDGNDYTWRTHYKQITYVLRDAPYVPDGYVCLGLLPVTITAVNDALSEWRGMTEQEQIDEALRRR